MSGATKLDLVHDLRRYALRLGAAGLAVTDASSFLEEKTRLEKRKQLGWCTPFEESDPEKRCHPELLLPGARSLIAIAVPYGQDPPVLSKPDPDRPRGRVSCYSWGKDYHHVLRQMLEKLVGYLKMRAPVAFRSLIMVDTGPLIDRAVAERSGLGWIGKNCCLIVPGAGSWVFLGQILTTLPLADEPMREFEIEGCGDCRLCLDACPTGALVDEYQLNPNRCIGYLTQMPGDIPRELRAAMGDQLWGCDICQQVCPHNHALRVEAIPEFRPANPASTRPYLDEIARMTKGQFNQRFRGTAAAWRGKKTWQRNALIAMGNKANPASIPILVEALGDGRREIRTAAAWALGRYAPRHPEIKRVLLHRLEVEAETSVRLELMESLKLFDGGNPIDARSVGGEHQSEQGGGRKAGV